MTSNYSARASSARVVLARFCTLLALSLTACGPDFLDQDTDADGIINSSDLCPTVAETVNGFEDDDGCPDVPPASIDARFDGDWDGTMTTLIDGWNPRAGQPNNGAVTTTLAIRRIGDTGLAVLTGEVAEETYFTHIVGAGDGTTIAFSGRSHGIGYYHQPQCMYPNGIAVLMTSAEITLVDDFTVKMVAHGVANGCEFQNAPVVTTTTATIRWGR